MSDAFDIVGRERVFDSYVFGVERRTIEASNERFTRDVVTHAGAVAVLAIDDQGRVGLLRQWRASFDDVNWELPAGTRDVVGEDPADTARRELIEELGCEPGSLDVLFRFMNSRGWTDQTTIVYVARDLVDLGREPSGPEELASEVHWLSPRELAEILDGEGFIESSTLMALNWYLGRHA